MGCGGSTQALLERCPFIERLVSIEHAPAWYERVQEQVKDPRLSLFLVEPDQPISARKLSRKAIRAWKTEAEEHSAVMSRYVNFPSTLETHFDFIFVDGRARSFCLEAGYDVLCGGGAMMIHDAQRTCYHATLEGLMKRGARVTFLDPWIQGQMCLVRKSECQSAR